jgi:hypothetical protein
VIAVDKPPEDKELREFFELAYDPLIPKMYANWVTVTASRYDMRLAFATTGSPERDGGLRPDKFDLAMYLSYETARELYEELGEWIRTRESAGDEGNTEKTINPARSS